MNHRVAISIGVGVLAVVLAASTFLLVVHDAAPRAETPIVEHEREHGVARPPIARPTLPPIESGALRLEGQAVDEHEQPIAGAAITIGDGRTTISEADGSFAFDNLGAGSYTVIGELGALYGETPNESLGETTDPIQLVLREGPTVVIHVERERDGVAIAGAKVSLADRERTTAADGTVMFPGVGIGDFWVEATAPGYARQRVRLDTGEEPAALVPHTLRLGPGATLAGTVIDEHGTAVPEARVEVHSAQGGWSFARADDQGRWQLEDVGEGSLRISATSDIHVATTPLVVDFDGTPRGNVVVHVEVGGTISGVVVDSAGHPVAEATVDGGRAREDSGADGRFVLRGLEPGVVEVTAKTGLAAAAVVKVELARGGRGEARLVLREASIAGFVKDTDGAPIADAHIVARHKTLDISESAFSDDTGRFDLGGIERGEYDLFVTRPREPAREAVALRTVRTPARGVTIVLPDHAKLVGRVTLDGAPVPYYGVIVASENERDSPQLVRVRDGRFARTDVPPGTWTVTIVGPAFATKRIENVVVASGTVDLGDIAVERGRTLAGRVVDDSGRSLAGALVSVGPRREQSLSSAANGERWTRSDAAGRYLIAGLDLDHSAYARATHAHGISQTIKLADDVTQLDLVVETTGSIHGRIVNMAGEQRNVSASTIDYSPDSYDSDIDARGEFVIPRIPAGEYELSVNGENMLSSVRVVVRAGQRTEISIAMPRTPILVAIQAKRCDVIYIKQDGTSIGLGVCHDNRAELQNLAPGRYEACIDDDCTPFDIAAAPPMQSIALPR